MTLFLMTTCLGNFGDASGAVLEYVTYWTYRTIKELRQQIADEIGIVKLCLVSTVMRDDAKSTPLCTGEAAVDQYLGLYSLQKHDCINEIPVSQTRSISTLRILHPHNNYSDSLHCVGDRVRVCAFQVHDSG